MLAQFDTQNPSIASPHSASLAELLASRTLKITQIGKYHTTSGHGFAAENINRLADVLTHHQTDVIGVSDARATD